MPGPESRLFLKEVLFLVLGRLLGSSGFLLNGGLFLEELVELGRVEFGLLEHFHFSEDNVLKRVDELGGLEDGVADGLSEEGSDKAGQVVAGSFGCNFISHNFSDSLDLGSLGVAGLLDLSLGLFGEAHAEASEDEAVLGLDLAHSLNEVLPFLDELAEFISGHAHSVEAGSDVLSLGVLDPESDFSPGVVIRVVLQVGKRNFNDSSFYSFRGDSCSGGSCDAGLSEVFHVKRSRGLEVVPFLSG